jgi:hypothetical protein
MLKPIQASTGQFQSTPPVLDTRAASIVFRMMHGFYGNQFASKFSSGDLVQTDGPDKGKDRGILSARKVWAYELRGYSDEVIGSAIEDCKKVHPKFPPSLPEFEQLCRANKPVEVYRPEIPAIGMSQELRGQYARRARAINEKHAQKAIDKRTGFVVVDPGLQGLFQCIANAVAAAGGDEAAELNRLDRLFPQGAPA